MKKYLMALAAVATLLAGCGKSDDGGGSGGKIDDGGGETPSKPAKEYATFEEYCLDTWDADGDGKIDIIEVAHVTSLDVSNCGWSNLNGIEKFESLTTLNCSGNLLGALELKNYALKYLDCSHCSLLRLTIASSNLETLIMSDNSLRKVDLTHCTRLKRLVCKDNREAVVQIYVADGLTLTAEIDKMAKVIDPTEVGPEVDENSPFWKYCIEKFDTDKDGKLSTDEAAAVSNINVAGMGLQSVDGIARFTDLLVFDCSNNCLTSLDVSNNKRLADLNCSNNKITEITLDGEKLTTLNCSYNALQELAIPESNNGRCNEIYCYNNQLGYIDISSCSKDAKLNCLNNAEGLRIKIPSNHSSKMSISKDKTAYTIQDKYGLGDSYTVIHRDSDGKLRLVTGRVFRLIDNVIGGVVYATSEHGAVVADEGVVSGYLAWSTEAVATGATDVANGAENVAEIQKIAGWSEKYPAVRACYELPGAWYLPSQEELRSAADVPATAFISSGVYVSSTEADAAYGKYVRGDRAVYKSEKSETGRVRCVMTF